MKYEILIIDDQLDIKLDKNSKSRRDEYKNFLSGIRNLDNTFELYPTFAENIQDAIAAFESTLITPNSRFRIPPRRHIGPHGGREAGARALHGQFLRHVPRRQSHGRPILRENGTQGRLLR